MQDSEASSLIGQALGEYLLSSVLGVGGMAEVYRALDRPKDLQPGIAPGGTNLLTATLGDQYTFVLQLQWPACAISGHRPWPDSPLMGARPSAPLDGWAAG